jgi:hypothetical protein
MRGIPILAIVVALVCAACQPLPDATLAGPAGTAGAQPMPTTQPQCSSYTVPLMVGGQPQQAIVEACQQPDGSWRITQTTPGLPPQVYEVPASGVLPYSSAYPYPDFSAYWDWAGTPYWDWGGAPWFLGIAPSVVAVHRFNHFHGFYGFHGFHHGFAHGFGHMHGFGGHGFAGMHGGGMHGGGMGGSHR